MYFMKMNFKIVTAANLKKWLKQIKLPISLYTSASNSKLPYNVSTMLGFYNFNNKICKKNLEVIIIQLKQTFGILKDYL